MSSAIFTYGKYPKPFNSVSGNIFSQPKAPFGDVRDGEKGRGSKMEGVGERLAPS